MIGLHTLGTAYGAPGFLMLALKICLAGRLRIQTQGVAGVAQHTARGVGSCEAYSEKGTQD